jgi:hypothetical protein
MKKIYITLVAIAITIVAAFNVCINLNTQKSVNLAAVSLENLDALAEEVTPPPVLKYFKGTVIAVGQSGGDWNWACDSNTICCGKGSYLKYMINYKPCN